MLWRRKGGNWMEQNKIREEVIECLVEFIKVATKENATSDKVAVLPEVAQVVLNNIF